MKQITESEWNAMQRELAELRDRAAMAQPAAEDARLAELLAQYLSTGGRMVILETHELVRLMIAERAARQGGMTMERS